MLREAFHFLRSTLYRKIHARVVRFEEGRLALDFAEHDFVADAAIQDLLFYQSRERRLEARKPARYDILTADSERLEYYR